MKSLLTGLLLIGSVYANDCTETRAALDIGSGTTKLKVASIDICLGKLVKILHESDRPVGYKQDLKESINNTLSPNILSQGIVAVNELKKEAIKYDPVSYIAVATSAFRTATNGYSIAGQLGSATGVDVKVITQEQEAKIGFVGASVISDVDLRDTVVWDIGGGSMQITSYNGNGKFDIYEGKLASVSFKNHIIEEVQNKNPKDVKSPNPISRKAKRQSSRDAKIIAKMTIPQSILNKIQSPATQLLGIGGVHYYAVAKKVSETKTYTRKMVSNKIRSMIGMTDQQIGGDYAITDLSNLILVEGFMRGLGATKVKVGKINLADGLLIDPSMVDK